MLDGTALAFDFGTRRIGVAIGESLIKVTHPLTTINSTDNAQRLAAIHRLIDQWQPSYLVVGLPTHTDGTTHELTSLARRFAQQLKDEFSLPVSLVDERYTSVVAESLLTEAGISGRRQKPMLDQVAAQAILQTWFEFNGETL